MKQKWKSDLRKFAEKWHRKGYTDVIFQFSGYKNEGSVDEILFYITLDSKVIRMDSSIELLSEIEANEVKEAVLSFMGSLEHNLLDVGGGFGHVKLELGSLFIECDIYLPYSLLPDNEYSHYNYKDDLCI